MTTAAQRDSAIAALTAKVADHEKRITALEAPVVVPPPVEPPPVVGKSVTVTTVAGLLAALSDNTLDEIVVKNGTYAISSAGLQNANSLWIGSKFAARTRPILVRAETSRGVTFDGSGSANGGISFNENAHDQTWQGFVFANCRIQDTGLITSGGYSTPPAHHITLRDIGIGSSNKGSGSRAQGFARDHAFYGGHAGSAIHDFTLEDFDIDCAGGLASGFHLYGAPGAYNMTFRRFRISNAKFGLMIYESTLSGILFDTGTITGSSDYAVEYVHPNKGTTLRAVSSTGSGAGGLHTPEGTAGLTVDPSCSLA